MKPEGRKTAVPVPAPRAGPWWTRVPPAVSIIGIVVVVHVLFFWLVADKHFLPKTRQLPPAPPPANFATRAEASVDPATGETLTEQLFVVSTRLASPSPSATPARQTKP